MKVTRLNTYTTIPAVWSEEQLLQARAIDIVTFASPSAVRTWSEKVGTDFTAVVIGPTSAKEAVKQGFKWVVSPEGSKGIGAWAEKIKIAAADFQSSNRTQKRQY
jgi:uroporphyrinogen-III synthase